LGRWAGENAESALVPSYERALFLADETASDIDPAVRPDHTGDADAIFLLACGGVAKLKGWSLAKGSIGRFRLAPVLQGVENLGPWRDRQRRCENRRPKTGHRDTCHGIFKGLISNSFMRLYHDVFHPLLSVKADRSNFLKNVRQLRAVLLKINASRLKRLRWIRSKLKKLKAPTRAARLFGSEVKLRPLVTGSDGRVTREIAPRIIDRPVLPITAAVIARTVGVGRSRKCAEHKATEHSRRNGFAPAIITAAPPVAGRATAPPPKALRSP